MPAVQALLEHRDTSSGQIPADQIGIIVGCCLGALVLVLLVVWCVRSSRRQRAWLQASRDEEDEIDLGESEASSRRTSRRRQHEAYRVHAERMQQMQQVRQWEQTQAQEPPRAATPPFPRSIPPPTLRPGETPVYRVKRPEPTYSSWQYAARQQRADIYRGY
ncbi:T-cell surface glycoprotein CD2 [Microdochium nivale]|nr:T-cell surface glycoprotein CD2 [Microdochium nivale]